MNIVIIKAGGLGTRAHCDVPKQFVEIKGKPLIVHTIECFQKNKAIDEIIISITHGWEDIVLEYKKKYKLSKITHVVTGGRSGLESIMNAYQMINYCCDDDVIIVHEANRPILTQEEIVHGIEMTKKNNKFGISYKVISEHLIGFINKEGEIYSSQYDEAFALYTHPEYITYAELKNIMKNIHPCLIEKYSSLDQLYGEQKFKSDYVNFIKTHQNNIKVTFAEDFDIIETSIE